MCQFRRVALCFGALGVAQSFCGRRSASGAGSLGRHNQSVRSHFRPAESPRPARRERSRFAATTRRAAPRRVSAALTTSRPIAAATRSHSDSPPPPPPAGATAARLAFACVRPAISGRPTSASSANSDALAQGRLLLLVRRAIGRRGATSGGDFGEIARSGGRAGRARLGRVVAVAALRAKAASSCKPAVCFGGRSQDQCQYFIDGPARVRAGV